MGRTDGKEVSLAVESKTSKEGLTIDEIFSTVDRSKDDEDVSTFYIYNMNYLITHFLT